MATNAKNLAELLNTDTTVAVGDVADNSITADKLDIVGNGNAGQFLKTDGDGSFSYIDAPTVKTPTQQIFTADGTWTRPTGCTKVRVTVIGGGGGAGGNKTYAGYNGHVGINGAGGGGGTSIKLLDVSSIASVTVTVGDGGAGGAASTLSTPQAGSAGGTSSFGTYATANGGGGGSPCGFPGNASASSDYPTLAGFPGVGGTAADGDLNLKGEDGHLPARDHGEGIFSSGYTLQVTGPRGGQAAGLSAGNARGTGNFSSQQAAGGGSAGEANTGNGGQSVAANRLSYGSTGAAGGSGIVIVDEFYS